MENNFAKPEHGAVWVTGASTGIGKAIAIKLADEGFCVYITARKQEKLDLVSKSYKGRGKIISAASDVTDRQAMTKIAERIVKENGAISLAIFNAGIFLKAHGNDLSFDIFDKTMAVNFTGVINGMVPVIEHMKKAGGGQIAVVFFCRGFWWLAQRCRLWRVKGRVDQYV